MGCTLSRNAAGERLAIAAVDAQRVIDELRTGDFESRGVDPVALGQGLGMWVASVRNGTEADRLGILPGDVITELGGVQLGRDGTAEEYCEALRNAESGRQIDIAVERPGTNASFEGEINGSPLVEVMAMALPDAPTGGDAADAYTEFRFVADDTATISMEVPLAFVDVDGLADN